MIVKKPESYDVEFDIPEMNSLMDAYDVLDNLLKNMDYVTANRLEITYYDDSSRYSIGEIKRIRNFLLDLYVDYTKITIYEEKENEPNK